jgi:peptide/nickel transport system permease protein
MNNLAALINRLLNPRARMVTESLPVNAEFQQAADDSARRRISHIRRAIRNPSLIIGSLITLGLLLIIFFGPFWAAQNPHLNPLPIPFADFDPETNQTIRPPLAPSAEYPLGTDSRGIDNLSGLLHGARITLVTATFITLARIILGLVLGSLAGWANGRLPDRIVMQLTTVITAIPMLISAMILVYAIGIESGMPTFIIALSVIGWTEIAQVVRSEILVLRRQLFVEAARSIGLNEIEIVIRHLLPNIVPRLFIISFLEMGAVLILLAELGFLGVFMGGNNRIILDDFGGPPVFFPDTPEWGAMLSEGVRYLRSKPFVIIGPAVAFFVAIIGFNSLGEGLRALFERSSINTAFLLKKRFVLLVAGVSMATYLIIQNTGPAFWYQRTAAAFDPVAAGRYLNELSAVSNAQQPGETIEGHVLTPTASYLYETFKGLGLQPGWKEGINSRYIYAPDEETAHVIGFWPGYDLDLSGELIIIFTTYDVPGDNDEDLPLGLSGHDLTDLAVLLESIQLMKVSDVNPRRSLLFVAWQAGESESGDLEEYVSERDNFRRLSTGSGGVRIAPTMVVQIDSGGKEAGLWIHPNSPEQVAELIRSSAEKAGVPTIPAESQTIQPLVSSLPWTYFFWSGADPAAGQEGLAQYGQILALTLVNLVREEQSWIAEEEEPELIFIPPTPTPGGTADDESEAQEIKAIGRVTIPEAVDTSIGGGDFFVFRFQVTGADGAYLAGQPYENLRLRVSVRSAEDGSIVTFDQTSTGSGNDGQYGIWISIPDDVEAGDYYFEITAISTSFQGNDLELVGDLEIPFTIAPEEDAE